MRDSNVANPAKESAQVEFPHGLLDFCTTIWPQQNQWVTPRNNQVQNWSASAQSGRGAQAGNFAGRERRIDRAAPSTSQSQDAALILAAARGAARGPWRWDHVRISSLRRRLLDAWIHLFRMDDSVRLVQLFAQALGRVGARCSLIWRRAGRLGEGRAGDERDAGDNQAKS